MRIAPRRLLLGIAFTLMFVGSASAQSKGGKDDALDQARKTLEVAAQKAESDIRATLLSAEKLAATDPAKAVDLLKEAKTKLEDTTELSEARRATLKRIFTDRIRVTEAMIEQAKRDESEKADQKAKTSGRDAAEAERKADADEIKRDLTSIRALREQGKSAEADRQATDLAKR
ncbi:MAG TPA: hypothetical protein VGG61_14000, partial [Gemmataceae bacterium]